MTFGGQSVTTFTPVGFVYFISSTTTFGMGASTTTQGTATTVMSTYPYVANTLTVPGSCLTMQCTWKMEATAPGTPSMGTYFNATEMANSNASTANEWLTLTTTFKMMQNGEAIFWTTAKDFLVAGGSGFTTTSFDATPPLAFNFAANQSLYCKASRASGGNIDFVQMSVDFVCRP